MLSITCNTLELHPNDLAPMATNGPLPTHLTFLTSLPFHPAGKRVRFLGCVVAYNVHRGVLVLWHAYPSAPSSSNVLAVVDVTVIVETMRREDLEVGAWINVIGYVQEREGDHGASMTVGVQAIIIWGAEGVKLGEYEKAVAGRLVVEGEGRATVV